MLDKDEYFLVNPVKNEEFFDCYKDLLPGNYDRNKKNELFLGACDKEGNPLGTLMVDVSDVVYDISWIYVAPENREQGVGKFLINGFLDYVEDTVNYRTVEAIVDYDQDELKHFFASLKNFDVDEAGEVLEINGEKIKNSKLIEKLPKAKFDAELFLNVSEEEQDNFLKKISDKGFFTVKDRQSWKESLINNLCICQMNKGKIASAILFSNGEDKVINLDFLYSEGDNEIMALLSAAIDIYLKKYKDKTIRMITSNPSVERFVKDVFADCDSKDVRAIYTWNFD